MREASGANQLLAAARSGDRAAAERLVEVTYRDVYAALFRFTGGNADLAADLTQDTFRKAWESLATFRGDASVSTWLFRIAYTTFLNHVRRPRRFEPLDESHAELPDPGPPEDSLLQTTEARQRLRRALLGLDERLRFVVTARYWGELSVAEIAAILGITPVAVRKRLAKAFDRLHRALPEVQP